MESYPVRPSSIRPGNLSYSISTWREPRRLIAEPRSRAPRGEHEATSERDHRQLKLADNKADSFSVKAMKHRETIIALDDVKAFHAPPDIHRLP